MEMDEFEPGHWREGSIEVEVCSIWHVCICVCVYHGLSIIKDDREPTQILSKPSWKQQHLKPQTSQSFYIFFGVAMLILARQFQ